MTEEIMTKEQLQTVINEMSSRVVKVAELVDQVFPEQGAGVSIKDCADKLCSYVQAVSVDAPAEIKDEFDLDPLAVLEQTVPPIDTLRKAAMENCLSSFKKIKAYENEESLSEQQIDDLYSLRIHSRDLFSTLIITCL